MEAILDPLKSVTDILNLILVPLLLIELVILWRARNLNWSRRTKEMVTNILSPLFLYSGALLTYWIWEPLFRYVHDVLPYNVPVNWMTVCVAILAADFTYYWEHRFEHENRGLWALWHSVHHSSPEYDITTSLRLGFFDGMLTTVFYMPMVMLGFEPLVVAAATALVIGYQTWIHTELIQKMPRWFEAVFNTPSHHRAHHGADEIYLDKNYGAIFIFWDRLFGTFQEETHRPTYGLTTQINSSNPLDVQFFELRGLIRDLRADTSWLTRWRRLWNRPGWQPAAVASGEKPSDISY